MTRCRVDAGDNLVGMQELRVRHRDCDPVSVATFPTPFPVPDPFHLCALLGDNREGFGSVVAGVLQRLGVTPDGSGVVFEVTNQFQLIGKIPLAPEQEGFFFVRADGSGLRRLAPPSRDTTYRIFAGSDGQLTANFASHLFFSPGGRTVAYTDLGPAPDGRETIQVFTLDLVSGRRSQVTHLPVAPEPAPGIRVTSNPYFTDEHTIEFLTYAVKEGGLYDTDIGGTALRARPIPPIMAPSGNALEPVFSVSAPVGRNIILRFPDTGIAEVFRLSGKEALQLTNFGRVDTAAFNTSPDGRRLLLLASADPFGTNPFENCQMFTEDVLGGGLRQLTRFDEGTHSVNGCDFTRPPGCAFAEVLQDHVTGTIIFYSNCAPFGSTGNASQIFALRADGTRLRQLTRMAGESRDADGTIEVESAGPLSYSTRLVP